jgi:hypothetical protein
MRYFCIIKGTFYIYTIGVVQSWVGLKLLANYDVYLRQLALNERL